MVTLGQKLAFLYPSANPRTSWTVLNTGDGTGEHITFFDTGSLGAQPSQGTLDAVTELQVTNAIAAAASAATKAAATAAIDNGDTAAARDIDRLARAVALVALDAFNTDRAAMAAMNTAVQAASSLANLKTLFAAINLPSQVTANQLVTAIKAKIAATGG